MHSNVVPHRSSDGRRWRRPALAAALGLLLSGGLLAPAAASGTESPEAAGRGEGGHCARMDRLRVPGAAHQQSACLAELTTAGTVASGHTVKSDWAGLTATGMDVPTGVPGIQIDGYFPDSSTGNTHHGWNHDSQFVIRLPDDWNGGLVVTGAPGVRAQYANDRAIADHVLARGYAFAATDKGNVGGYFFRDGRRPGDAVAEWNRRVTQLTRAARAAVVQRYHRPPERTLAAGLSNGGYLVRWQLENRPWLYDGGVDWEGTLWRADGHGREQAGQGPNLFTFLPPALRAYPVYEAGGPGADEAHRRLVEAGFPAGSEFLWPYHYAHYWDVTQRIYREEFDPGYDGEREAGTPFCEPGGGPGCDTDYVYADRPHSVHRAVDRIGLTGRIGKPLITFHGTLDVLLPISESSDTYARMVRDAGRGDLLRYYRIEDGTHVDGLFDAYPERLRPLEPCFRASLAALEGWLDGVAEPPPGGTVGRPAGADRDALMRTCRLSGADA